MKPFEPDQVKTFRTPKYTGVSLSLLSMFVLTSMIVVWNQITPHSQPEKIALSIACESILEIPVRASAAQFEKEFNLPIEIKVHSLQEVTRNYLSHSHHENNPYDLFIGSDFMPESQILQNKIFKELISVAKYLPVFATRSDFGLEIKNWSDILDHNLTIGQIDFKNELGHQTYPSHKIDESFQIDANILPYYSISSLTNSLLNSTQLDGVIIEHDTARKHGLKIHQVEELDAISIQYSAQILSRSNLASKGLQFARYLAAPSKGQFHFANHNLIGVDGDRWSKCPTITIYSEPNFTKIMTPSVDSFVEREGIQINLLFPRTEKLVFTISSISQSTTSNLLPDLLLVSPKTAKKIPPDYISLKTGVTSPDGLFLLNSNSHYRSLTERYVDSIVTNL